jgi:hypothetical protein
MFISSWSFPNASVEELLGILPEDAAASCSPPALRSCSALARAAQVFAAAQTTPNKQEFSANAHTAGLVQPLKFTGAKLSGSR